MASKNPHHPPQNASLELKEGNKEIKIAPKDLTIVWGNDDRYWSVPNDESAAVLFQVSWLEVRGCVKNLDRNKDYEVGFNISLTPDAFGWGSSPIFILVRRGKTGKFKPKKILVERDIKSGDQVDIKAEVPKLEKPAGEKPDPDGDSMVYFGMYEVWSGKWKGGLKIHHAFVREHQASS